jgi:hypothetical protein
VPGVYFKSDYTEKSIEMPIPKRKIQKTKTLELQTMEITRPLRSKPSPLEIEHVRPPKEKTRPKIVLETTAERPKQQKVEAPLFQEKALRQETSDARREERIEWRVALIFSGLAVVAAVIFDLI